MWWMCWQISGKEGRTWSLRHQHFHVTTFPLWPNISSAVPSNTVFLFIYSFIFIPQIHSAPHIKSTFAGQQIRELNRSWTGAPSSGSIWVTAKMQAWLWLILLGSKHLKKGFFVCFNLLSAKLFKTASVNVWLKWLLLYIFDKTGLIRTFHLWPDDRYKK